MRTGNTPRYALTRLNPILLVCVFTIVVAVLADPVYSVRSTSLPTRSSSHASIPPQAPADVNQVRSLTDSKSTILKTWSSIFMPLSPTPQALPETIATYAGDCVTAQTHFNLGDTVCAKVTNFSGRSRAIYWVDPNGGVVQQDPITASNSTSLRTINQAGKWQV